MKAILFLASLCVATFAPAADWPQWRGPNRDGATQEPNLPLAKLPGEPKIVWQVPAGPGQSSPVVAGGQVIFMDGVNDSETVHALDEATGKEQWSAKVAPMVSFQNNYGEGPRCTPIIDGEHVYVQSCSGEFQCLERKTGKVKWRTNFETEYGATFLGNKSGDPAAKETASRRHGNNGSAVVDGDRIFVPVGGAAVGATLVCFEKLTGKELWRVGSDNTAYSSVMVGTLAGRRQVVHLTADALMGVDTQTGALLWREPLKTGAKRHVCTPVLVGDTVTVASATIGTLQLRITEAGGKFTAEKAWANLPLKTNIATPVRLGGSLYTLGAGSRTDLTCIDLLTGEPRWTKSGFGDYASITVINNTLLALDSTGELVMAKASPDSYEELGRLQVSGKTWASPAYVNGKLYVKDDGHLTALQLAP